MDKHILIFKSSERHEDQTDILSLFTKELAKEEQESGYFDPFMKNNLTLDVRFLEGFVIGAAAVASRIGNHTLHIGSEQITMISELPR